MNSALEILFATRPTEHPENIYIKIKTRIQRIKLINFRISHNKSETILKINQVLSKIEFNYLIFIIPKYGLSLESQYSKKLN